MKLPFWPPRDWRAFIALTASIGGSMALTGFAGALVSIFTWGGWSLRSETLRLEFLGKALLLSLAGSLVVLISLGLAINKRTVKLSKDGLDVSGGDDDTPKPIVTTTTTTAVTAAPAETPA